MNLQELLLALKDQLQTGPGYSLTIDKAEQKAGRHQLNLHHHSWASTTPLLRLHPDHLELYHHKYHYEDPQLLNRLQDRLDIITKGRNPHNHND